MARGFESKMVEFQQGIWRYHPRTDVFELFAEGGGNTWGIEFDPKEVVGDLTGAWRQRLDAELAAERAWVARRVAREAEQAAWDEAWHSYKARLREGRNRTPWPRWWNLTGWVMWLLRLHAPGRPN